MKANELRIGNYIAHPNKEFDQVEEIWCKETGEGVEYAIKSKECHIAYYLMHEGRELIRGIPLTEDWLLKFGFTKFESPGIVGYDGSDPDETTYYFERDRFTIVQWGTSTPYFFSNHGLRVELTYVHELQNLFHALTGQELETLNP